VAKVVVAPAAAGDLDLLIRELELPPSTRSRVRITVVTIQDSRAARSATSQR